MSGQTGRRTEMRDRLDTAIRSVPDVGPIDEDFQDGTSPYVGDMLLNGWVLVADYVDEEGDSCVVAIHSPGLSRPAVVGLLSLAYDSA